jgi:CRISPR-associated exonuclease Cas4
MILHEDDYLPLSEIQHYAFCPRQWCLMRLESKWADNWRTISGAIMHERAHNAAIKEKRNDVITLHALKVVSHTLGLSGECDVVEFYRDDNGIELSKYAGKYRPFPVEYKRGKAKSLEADQLQLCAQAMGLEEMLCCSIQCGALFYGESHRRIDVDFSTGLRDKVKRNVAQMHKILRSGITVKAVIGKHCSQCSLNDECVPEIQKIESVRKYMLKHIEEG